MDHTKHVISFSVVQRTFPESTLSPLIPSQPLPALFFTSGIVHGFGTHWKVALPNAMQCPELGIWEVCGTVMLRYATYYIAKSVLYSLGI